MDSNCCSRPLKVVTGGEGTSHWVCSGCDKPADPKRSSSQTRTVTSRKSPSKGLAKLRKELDELDRPTPPIERLEKTADYLYKIDGDCPPEIYQAIATLRQLINEEFKPTKPLSSQFIYDVLFRKIDQYYADFYRDKILEARKEELEFADSICHFHELTDRIDDITAQFNSKGVKEKLLEDTHNEK